MRTIIGMSAAVAVGCACAVLPGLHDGGRLVTDAGVSDVRMLYAESSGGFGQPACPVDGGWFSGVTYRVSFDAGLLEYEQCELSPREIRSGSKGLTSDDLVALAGAIDGLIPDTTGCGADKPILALEVTTSTTTLRYKDTFYACNHEPGTIYVANIDPVFSVLSQLAQ